jgi:hypothetical protein
MPQGRPSSTVDPLRSKRGKGTGMSLFFET